MSLLLQLTALLIAAVAGTSAQQTQVYLFSGAIEIWPSSAATSAAASPNPSAAVLAQCPVDHPVSCVNLQEPYYCCPANNVCDWSDGIVACCPIGATCTGSIASHSSSSTPAWSSWSPSTTSASWTSWVAPSTTTWWTPGTPEPTALPPQQQTTVYVPGAGGGAGQTQWYPSTTTQTQPYYYPGEFCATYYEVGPQLPTTAVGACGTVLILSPSTLRSEASERRGARWRGVSVLLGVQVLAVLLWWV